MNENYFWFFNLLIYLFLILNDLSCVTTVTSIFVSKYRRKNSNRQGSTNAQPSFGLLVMTHLCRLLYIFIVHIETKMANLCFLFVLCVCVRACVCVCKPIQGWCNGARRGHLINESAMAEPFRSRDDLLPDQQCRPRAIRHQPYPDST